MDYDKAKEISADPWNSKLRDLAPAARLLFIAASGHMGPLPWHADPETDERLATMLLSVLQARALRRATWALVAVTFGLVVATVVLVFITATS